MAERLPPLRLLTVFEAVLRCGGVQRAANELNVSQPAISQAVRQLEAHLGLQLFDRRTRPATLTEAGRLLQRSVTEGLGRISEAIGQARALQADAAHSLTISCTVGTATYWLMPSLTGFHARHDDIAVSVRTSAQGLPPLGPGIDLAIRYGLGEWSDGSAERLFRERVVPVCTPALAARFEAAGRDLGAVSLLHVDAEVGNWIEWPEYLARAGLAANPRKGRRFTNYVQATQAALGGLGVLLGWRSNVAALLQGGELVELPCPAVEPEEAFYLVRPRVDRGPSAALDPLVAWLLQTGKAAEHATG